MREKPTKKFAKIFHKSIGRKSTCLALLAGLFLMAGSAAAQDFSSLPWGKAKNGLKMAVYPAPPAHRAPGVRFVVVFQNTGKDNLAVNLGVFAANEKKPYPNNIVLVLTDMDRPRTLALRDTGANAPGATPMVVRMNPGGTYSFSVNLNDYWFPPNGDFGTNLSPGPYSVEARFTGQTAAAPAPISATSNTSASFWIGSIKSKKTHFYVGGPGYWPYRRYGPYGYAPYGPYGYPPPYYGRPYPPPPPPRDPYGYGPPPNRGQQQPPPDDGQNGAQSQSQSPSGDDQAAPQDDGQPPQQDNGSPSSPPNGPPPSQ
jgi:hypothetical protein